MFLLCDCETGYVLDIIIYTGKETEISNTHDLGISGAVVTTLLDQYLDKGHCIFLDNWYTSPDLFAFLHSRKTNACGTVKNSRLGMPKFEKKKMQVGQVECFNDGTILATKWTDKRDVHMLSTEHGHEMKNTEKSNPRTKEQIIKPSCVLDYNLNMGAVDRSDMMIVHLECVRRSTRWYKKLFFHFLDLTILNAHALFLCKTGKRPNLQSFHLALTRAILEKYTEPRAKKSGGRPSSGETPLRLTQRHFPSLVPPTPKRKDAMRVCHVCKHTSRREQKRRESRYMCKDCDVALCVVPCFAEYHEITNF